MRPRINRSFTRNPNKYDPPGTFYAYYVVLYRSPPARGGTLGALKVKDNNTRARGVPVARVQGDEPFCTTGIDFLSFCRRFRISLFRPRMKYKLCTHKLYTRSKDRRSRLNTPIDVILNNEGWWQNIIPDGRTFL